MNKLNESQKEELKLREWDIYKDQANANGGDRKKSILGGLFAKKPEIALKLKFDLNRRYQEQLHLIDLTKLLRAKVLNLQGDEEMSVTDI